MGFSRGVPTTTDAMLYNYAFEQEITNKLRQVGKTDFSDVHAGAVNELIKELKVNGVDPATIVNTQDFEPELCFAVLAAIYAGEDGDAMPGNSKSAFYQRKNVEASKERICEFADGTKVVIGKDAKSLPKAANHDAGSYISSQRNFGENLKGALTGSQFNEAIRQRPLEGNSLPGYQPPA